MIYRDFGKTGLKVSAIGLGCEYLWHADEKTASEVIRTAVEAGINYYDLFVASAPIREYYGRALKPYRDKVMLAGHLGAAEINGQYSKTRDLNLCEKFINDFYEKLQTDYIDVLYLHNSDQIEDYQTIMSGGMYDYAMELKAAGKARLIGISTHSTRIAMEAVGSGKIDVLMFPVNPLFNMLPQDIADFRMKGRKMKAMTEEEKAAYPTKEQLYALCEEKGVPIVAMKPFAGGNILKAHEGGRLKGLMDLTPVQCISYVLSIPQVGCPVPGVASVDELNQSLAYLTAAEEERDFSEINDSIVAKFDKQCMYCNHCQPCPMGIDIAEVTKLADMAENGINDDIRQRYNALAVKGGDCVHCQMCTERCPFGIDGSANMQRAEELFWY